MHYIPITPFRRTVTAALMEHQNLTEGDLELEAVNKWHVLRDLTTGRLAFDLSHRDLAVLQALLSFHPSKMLEGDSNDLVVFPSNSSICERLNGMPCSTMRRHLAKLVDVGLIIRRDSPNGKRYRRRYGSVNAAFGFELTPLITRRDEIHEASEKAKAEALRIKQLREQISLMRRDLANLSEYGRANGRGTAAWVEFDTFIECTARTLRRKLGVPELEAIAGKFSRAITNAKTFLPRSETPKLSTSNVRSEQHYQRSNKNHLEKAFENAPPKNAGVAPILKNEPNPERENDDSIHRQRKAEIPISLILSACREIGAFAHNGIRNIQDMVQAAERTVPMMGITADTWDQAKNTMGAGEAAVVVAAMLERFEEIKSPGAYLRSLCIRAANGGFSCVPMVMALARRRAA